MSGMLDPVRVSERYFAHAARQLVEAGQARRVGAGIWGCSYVSAATGATVANFTDLRGDGVVCQVERAVFEQVIAQGHTYRFLSGTEYEMLCQKLEAHRRGDRKVADDIQLPAWTSGLFEQAIREGWSSFRGRSAQVAIPFVIRFAEACLDRGQREPTRLAERQGPQA